MRCVVCGGQACGDNPFFLLLVALAVVELLDSKRQPLPDMEAIYLLEPCEESVEMFIKDFKKKRKYRMAHLYFTSHLSDALMHTLSADKVPQASPGAPRACTPRSCCCRTSCRPLPA